MSGNHPLWGKIARIADRQLGHVTRVQLIALGCSSRWIETQLALGLLIRVHTGVYAVGHVPRHAHCRAMAAVLACGEDAVASGWSAAAFWDAAEWPAVCEVTSPHHRRRPGILTHRSRTLQRGDVRRRHGVPVTSPARTVLDLQSQLSDARLARLVNDLRAAGHLGPTAFGDLCRRSPRVNRLLGDEGRSMTRSELEDLFRGFVKRHRLPMPELNVRLRIGGRVREVDALYRQARLILELDSWRYHGNRTSFERDRAKDALALAEGFRTVRSTHRRLSLEGTEEAAMIRAILRVAD